MKEHLSFQEQSKQGISVEHLLEKARLQGPISLEFLDQEQQEQLLNWFSTHSNEFEPKDRTELLEHSLRKGIVNEHLAKKIIDTLPRDQKREVGLFIGKILDKTTYVRAFQSCWFDLSDSEREDFVTHYTKTEPQHIQMIVPFIDVTKVTVEKEGEKKSILETELNSLEKVHELLDLMFENNGTEVSINPHRVGGFPENLLHYYLEKNPLVLVEYLDQLEETNLLSENDKIKVLSKMKRSNYSSAFFLNETDKKELKRLEKGYEQKANLPYGIGSIHELIDIKDPTAKKIIELWKKEEREVVTRQIKTVCHLIKDKDERMEFLKSLKENDLPIFIAVQEMQLSSEEVLELMQHKTEDSFELFHSLYTTDLEEILNFYSKQENKKNEDHTHQLIVDEFLKDFQSLEEECVTSIIFASHIETYLPYFSKEQQTKLIEGITEFAPDLWLYSFEFAVTCGYCKPETYLEPNARFSEKFVIYHKRIVDYFLSKKEPEHANQIIDIAKSQFENWPSTTILVNSQPFKECYPTLRDREKFYEQHLSAPINETLVETILRIGNKHEAYFMLPKVFLENPGLFAEVITTSTEMEKMMEIFSWEQIQKFIETQFAKLSINSLLSTKVLILLIEDELFRAKILQLMKQHNRTHDGTKIVNCLNFQLKDRKKKLMNNILTNTDTKKKDARDPYYAISDSQIQFVNYVLIETLKDSAETEPGFIFREDVITRLQLDAIPFIRRDFSQAVQNNPLVLTRDHLETNELDVLKKAVGNDQYEDAVKKHLRMILFRWSEYGIQRKESKQFYSPEIQALIDKTDPIGTLLDEKQKTLVFYQSAMDRISTYKAFPFFRKKLEAIQERELEQKNGNINEPLYRLNHEFTSILDTIILFELSPLANLLEQEFAGSTLNKPELEQKIQLISFLSFYGIDQPVNGEQAWKELYERAKKKIQSLLGLESGDIQEVYDLDMETIQALSIYLQKQGSDVPELKRILKTTTIQILTGRYEQWRAWGNKHEQNKQTSLDQMKMEQLLPKKLSLQQYETWIQEDISSLEDDFKLEAKDLSESIRKLIEQAIADGHVDQQATQHNIRSLESELRVLQQPLADLMQKKQVIDKRIQEIKQAKRNKSEYEPLTPEEEALFEEYQTEIRTYRAEHAEDFTQVNAKLYFERLKQLTVSELQTMSLSIGKDKISIKRAMQDVERLFEQDHPGFIEDLRHIHSLIVDTNSQAFGEKRVSKQSLTLTDRVNAKTHLFIGEKPVPSCQSYKGNTDNARGLGSYLSDPNVKFIQLNNEQGEIQARSALRLLEDAEGNPYLFMERVYSTNAHPKIEEAFEQFGEMKAEKMGIPFKSQASKRHKNKGKTYLFSYASRAPFVYTDAGGGLKQQGKYRISV